MSDTLLLLGGTGFLGKSFLDAHFTGKLEELGIDELLVAGRSRSRLSDYAPPGTGHDIDARAKRLRILEIDLSTCTELPSADLVMHAATTVSLASSPQSPEDDMRAIEHMTNNLSRLLLDSSSGAQICYVSSGAVYGAAVTPYVPTSEEVTPRPDALRTRKGAYARGKLASEKAMDTLGKNGFPVTIARAFSFMGTHLLGQPDYALSSFIAAARRNETIHVSRIHPVFRSYMDAGDLVRWLVTLTMGQTAGTDIFNVGAMDAIELGDLAREVGRRWDVSVVDARHGDGASDDRTDEIEWYVPDTTKAWDSFRLQTTSTIHDFLDQVRQEEQ